MCTMKNKENRRFSHRWWFWGVIAVVLIAAIGGYLLLDSTKDNAPASMEEAMLNAPVELMTGEVESVPPEPTPLPIPMTITEDMDVESLPVFSFTPEEWVTNLAELNGNIGLPTFSFIDVDMRNTIFTLNQSIYVMYMGRMNADGEIYTVMFGGFGDGTDASGYEITLSMAIFVASLHPEYTPSESGAVISELGLLGESYPDEAVLTKDGTRYEFVNDPEVGIMFFASPFLDD